jgi:3-oxoacyl-[acyl-carrier protein] reductase/meso-butanediol dehydrogenase/(S,S)-butanediol dehydrogenase/diacetyl reductase
MVVVTGGGRGIGAAISRAFYNAGDAVMIGSRHDSGFAVRLGDRARFHPTDVRQPEQIEALINAAIDWKGRIDVLVNNAGFSQWRAVTDADETFWNEMIDTNLKGVFFGCRAAAARMTEGGSLINVSSLAGKRGSANNSVYCASKFGVNGITQALAKELGPRKIRVNAVCPVYVATDGVMAALTRPGAPAAGCRVDDYLSDFAKTQSALGRLPQGREVASVCLFLASEAASAITGQCINTDCGVMPQ